MAILGTLLKRGIRIRESIEQEYGSPLELQKAELKKLLISAHETLIGKDKNFKQILGAYKSHDKHEFYRVFQQNLPIYNYNSMYEEYWHRIKAGESNVTWKGRVKYFALSSGTSESASKYIPVTKDMIKAIQRTSIRQMLTLSKYDLPSSIFEKGILMLGGSTHLNFNGNYFEGDLSGITTGQIPFWFQHFYKPGKKIAKERDWNAKLDEITKNARNWDIGFIVGVPAWLQILMEKIIDYYQVETIHDIWPNLTVYTHGGVSFDPYRKAFEKLIAKPLVYIETYLASEGFIAFQAVPNRHSMRLVLNNGIFYEFVPFNDENFNSDGDLVKNPQTFMVDEIEEGVEYALLMSTCAGAWRYMIGDTIKFVSKEESEIVITGRTKHFLSLCGEHLSVDNMNKAVSMVADELNIKIKEFAVAGVPHDSLFAHHWYVGTDDEVDSKILSEKIDQHLMELNDDYKVERIAALKEVTAEVLPPSVFYDWMRMQGKEGGQNKFPRVLKKDKLESWKNFLGERKK